MDVYFRSIQTANHSLTAHQIVLGTAEWKEVIISATATNDFKFFQIDTWRKFNTMKIKILRCWEITVCYQPTTVLVRVKSDLTVNCFKMNSRRLDRFYIDH